MASWILALTLAFVAQSEDKLSLRTLIQSIQKTEEITGLYKATQDLAKDPGRELKPLLKLNDKTLNSLLKAFENSRSFVRGEIEDEKVLGRLMAALQLSMLKARTAAFAGQWEKVQAEFAPWFLFAADFPYEESSLVGLRTVGVIRALLLDEFEKIQNQFKVPMAKAPSLRRWFLKVRAPWPVDRVMISEAKRLLKPPMMTVANSAALAFQKNPYQTSEKALEKVRGGQSEQAHLLKQIWREADIQMMKSEINRIGKLKLRLAMAEFEQNHLRPAQTVEELLNAQLLDQAPLDYFTGQPLSLTSL